MPGVVVHEDGSWTVLPPTAAWMEKVIWHYGEMPDLFLDMQYTYDGYWSKILGGAVEVADANGYLRGKIETNSWPKLVDVLIWSSIAVVSIGLGFFLGLTYSMAK